MINQLEGKVYEERVRQLSTFSLQRRQLREDILAVFKYLKGHCKDKREQIVFLTADGQMCSNGLKLQKSMFGFDIRKNFFSAKAVRQRNRLPRAVVESPSLEVG